MFAVIGSVSGAPTCAATRPFSPPIPDEWRAALAQSTGPLVLPDGLLPLVWPD